MANEYEVVANFTANTGNYVSNVGAAAAANEEFAGSAVTSGGATVDAAKYFEDAGARFEKTTGGMVIYSDDFSRQFNGVADTSGNMAVNVDYATGKIDDMAPSLKNTGTASGGMASELEGASVGLASVGAAADDAGERASSGGAKANDGFRQFTRGIGEVMLLGYAIGMVGSVVVNVGSAMVQSVEGARQQQAAFTGLTGSASAAADTINQLDSTAKDFKMPQQATEDAGKQLLSMGVSAQDTTKDVGLISEAFAEVGDYSGKNLAPASAALVTLQRENIATTASVQALASTGIPAYQLIAEGMGMTAADAGRAEKLIASGALSGKQAFADLASGIQQNQGQIAATSDSLQAEWNNMGNIGGKAFSPIGVALDNLAHGFVHGNTVILGFISGLEQGQSASEAWSGALDAAGSSEEASGNALQGVASALGFTGSAATTASSGFSFFGSTLDIMPGLVERTAESMQGTSEAMGMAGSSAQAASAGMSSVSNTLTSLAAGFEQGSAGAQALSGSLGQASAMMEGMSNASSLTTTFEQGSTEAQALGGSLGQASAMMEGVSNAAAQANGDVGSLDTSFQQGSSSAQGFTSVLGSLSSALGSIFSGGISLPSIPGFASGVTNFGGGLAVVGESGPELVSLPSGSSVTPMSGLAPLSSIAGAGASQEMATINITHIIQLDSLPIAQATVPHIAPILRQMTGRRQ